MDRVLDALRAAGEHTRLRILALLVDAELTVSDLTVILGQSQPRVSRHLKILCEAQLLVRAAEGAQAFFRLADGSGDNSIARSLVALLPSSDATLERDQARLAEVRATRAAAASRYFEANAQAWNSIRARHVSESLVEEAMLDAAGDARIGELLDLGTGTGRVLELFADRIDRGLGIDLSREMLTVARTRLESATLGHCRVVKDDIYHLSVPAGGFDLVTIHHVLHFLENPGQAIREAARALRPRGRLIVVDFAPHDLEQLRTELAHRRLGFADEEIAAWCNAAGLTSEPPRHLQASKTKQHPSLGVTLWIASQRADAPSHHDLEVA